MGNLPMAVVFHGVDRYSGQPGKSAAIFFIHHAKNASLLIESTGVPIDIAEYREQGRGCPCHENAAA